MAGIPFILLLFTITTFAAECCGQEDSDGGPLTRTFRFHRPGLGSTLGENCEYRRKQGTCQRRSSCRRPTRKFCSIGLNPIVCCLDEPEKPLIMATKPPPVRPQPVQPQITKPPRARPPVQTTTILPPKTKPPITPTQTTPKVANTKEIDLVFPGCGSRFPRTTSPVTNNAAAAPTRGRQRTGFFRRMGKRETAGSLSRWKRRNQPVIVGGAISIPNSWPWMVAIYKKKTYAAGNNKFLCGASLISRKYVLTAAHCFDGERGNVNASNFLISVGAHNTKDGREYPVERISIHPDYKSRQYYNDICLLRIPRDVELNNKVNPVCLPKGGIQSRIVNSGQRNVTVTGWGDTSFGGVSSKVLQEVSFPIVSQRECNEAYTKTAAASSFPRGITDLFLCAGLKEGGKDACQGDSGGPLVTQLDRNEWVQLGVVSFGYGCAQPGFPGVYTRVEKFTKWLYDNTDLGK